MDAPIQIRAGERKRWGKMNEDCHSVLEAQVEMGGFANPPIQACITKYFAYWQVIRNGPELMWMVTRDEGRE